MGHQALFIESQQSERKGFKTALGAALEVLVGANPNVPVGANPNVNNEFSPKQKKILQERRRLLFEECKSYLDRKHDAYQNIYADQERSAGEDQVDLPGGDKHSKPSGESDSPLGSFVATQRAKEFLYRLVVFNTTPLSKLERKLMDSIPKDQLHKCLSVLLFGQEKGKVDWSVRSLFVPALVDLWGRSPGGECDKATRIMELAEDFTIPKITSHNWKSSVTKGLTVLEDYLSEIHEEIDNPKEWIVEKVEPMLPKLRELPTKKVPCKHYSDRIKEILKDFLSQDQIEERVPHQSISPPLNGSPGAERKMNRWKALKKRVTSVLK